MAGNRQDAVDVRELNEVETVKIEVDEESSADVSSAEYVFLFIKEIKYTSWVVSEFEKIILS